MVPIMQVTEKLKSYIVSQLDLMSKNTPIVGFIKPLATRALNKNFSKITKALDLIADDSGNIDVEGILTETIDNLISTKPFTVNVPVIGDIEIGGGTVNLNIPFTDKKLVFNTQDIESFKEILTTKNY